MAPVVIFIKALMMSCSPDAPEGTNQPLLEHYQPEGHPDARFTPL